MASEYPSTIATIPADKQDDTNAKTGADEGTSSTTGDHAAHHNKLAEEVVAVQTELGTDPSNGFATVKKRLDPLERRRRTAILMDTDFLEASVAPLLSDVSGTGATIAVSTVPSSGSIVGTIRMSTGTTATGRSAGRGNLAAIRLGNGKLRFETYLSPNILSDATNRYVLRVGFLSLITADNQHGVYFEYNDVTGPNWQLKTASNNARTTVDSGVAVTTNYMRLMLEVNAAGTQADFYIDGVHITNGTPAPITTNLPAANQPFGIALGMIKSVGTAARLVDVDYVYSDIELTTGR